jgi:hypothetical protein
MSNLIELRNLTKDYGRFRALDDVAASRGRWREARARGRGRPSWRSVSGSHSSPQPVAYSP